MFLSHMMLSAGASGCHFFRYARVTSCCLANSQLKILTFRGTFTFHSSWHAFVMSVLSTVRALSSFRYAARTWKGAPTHSNPSGVVTVSRECINSCCMVKSSSTLYVKRGPHKGLVPYALPALLHGGMVGVGKSMKGGKRIGTTNHHPSVEKMNCPPAWQLRNLVPWGRFV